MPHNPPRVTSCRISQCVLLPRFCPRRIRYALLQHQTRLYVVHLGAASETFFYQQVLRCWGNLSTIRFSSPIPIVDLYLLALETEPGDGTSDADGSGTPALGDAAAAAAARVVALLEEKAEMLSEYVSVEVAEGCLRALPQLIDGYVPPLNGLPAFIRRLAESVDWTSEQPCFEGIAKELARLYRLDRVGEPADECARSADPRESVAAPSGGQDGAIVHVDDDSARGGSSGPLQPACAEAWTVQHVLLPAMRRSYEPPAAHAHDGAVVQIACTEMLYKIFERC